MTMLMSQNKRTENSGIIYVQNVVRSSGCLFSQIGHENDYGNDCYIEFFTDDVATSFCAFAQIKSGKSYKDKTGYKIPTDRDHLEYWSNHTNPIVGIVYDDQLQKAFWINISEYIIANPDSLKTERHTIRLSSKNIFSIDAFREFQNHFIQYVHVYKGYENYGRSLEKFAHFSIPNECYEGLKSLYSNHRDKKATWYYMVSNFVNIKEPGIRLNLLLLMSNYIDMGHVLLNSQTYNPDVSREIRALLSKLLTIYFGEEEIYFALGYMKDGIVRGTYSYLLYAVLGLIEGIDLLLEKMAFKKNTNDEMRPFIMWLYMFYAQERSPELAIATANRYLKKFEAGDEDGMIEAVKEMLASDGVIRIG